MNSTDCLVFYSLSQPRSGRVVPAGEPGSSLRSLLWGDRAVKYFYVYIMCSQRNGTLYIGVTSDLQRRICAHKSNALPGFVSKYEVHMLVYYEIFEISTNAIRREKQLKNWQRSWKLDLIEKINPEWVDLSIGFLENLDPGSEAGTTP